MLRLKIFNPNPDSSKTKHLRKMRERMAWKFKKRRFTKSFFIIPSILLEWRKLALLRKTHTLSPVPKFMYFGCIPPIDKCLRFVLYFSLRFCERPTTSRWRFFWSLRFLIPYERTFETSEFPLAIKKSIRLYFYWNSFGIKPSNDLFWHPSPFIPLISPESFSRVIH